MMKINWNIRIKNPHFWAGIAGAILASTGTAPETLTTWTALAAWGKALIQNPYALAGCLLSIYGTLLDPTTAGSGDSPQALTYPHPQGSLDRLAITYTSDRRD